MAAAASPDAPDTGQDDRKAKIAECDRKLVSYRAALDAGASPATVAGWITEAETERAGYLSAVRPAVPRQAISKDDIAAHVARLADVLTVLRDADPADKADIYAQLGLRLTYRPGDRTVRPEADVSPMLSIGNSKLSEVRVAPHVHARAHRRAGSGEPVAAGGTDKWIRATTTGCVRLLALIAATVSYLHMHLLVVSHGQPGWVAVLTPFSVDGMIVTASMTLLSDSRSGGRGRRLIGQVTGRFPAARRSAASSGGMSGGAVSSSAQAARANSPPALKPYREPKLVADPNVVHGK